jgi:hypothetical protein
VEANSINKSLFMLGKAIAIIGYGTYQLAAPVLIY